MVQSVSNITGRRRVVVTGCGVINALGGSVEEMWQSLAQGKSRVRRMTEWSDYPNQIAAPIVLNDEAVKKIDRKQRRAMGNVALFAALAAREAVTQSGLDREFLSSGRCGCMVSSTIGSGAEFEFSVELWRHGNRELMPAMQFFKCASNSTTFNTANVFGITGVQMSPSAACASGMQAIGAAFECIQMGKQNAVIAGGADELTPLVNGTFDQLFALADGTKYVPEETSRPFDASRIGLVCSEGAGILVLEELEHAQRRGANILFEIAGYATNCSGVHLSQSERHSIAKCVRLALNDAGASADAVDYVSAHATSTAQGDKEEALGLRDVLGTRPPISSLKGHIGHTLGASGAIELIMTAEMMRRNVLLPTLNLKTPDPDLADMNLLREPTAASVDVFVKNSFAFGGINAVLVGRKFHT